MMMSARSPLSSPGNSFIRFKEQLNFKRYQHAVDFVGQVLLVRVLVTLIVGPVEKIKDVTKDVMDIKGSVTKYFTDAEARKLDEGKPAKWDITMLYKMVQRICGLAPVDSGEWTTKPHGYETLESLLFSMKQLRNQYSHSSHNCIMSITELESSLTEFQDLSSNIIDALVQTAADRQKWIEGEQDLRDRVDYIIADVQKQIVEPRR